MGTASAGVIAQIGHPSQTWSELEFVHLTEEEQVLVTEEIALHQELIEKLADVPTPAGPTPRELGAQRQGEQQVIPIKTVRRAKTRGL